MSVKKKGYIYIMTNPGMPGKIKIGFATNVKERCDSLFTTSVSDPFEVFATYEVQESNADKVFHKLIDKLNPSLRHLANREFYEMAPEEAYLLLRAVAEISGTLDKLEPKELKEKKANGRKMPKSAGMGSWPLCKYGVKPGDKLIYTRDNSVICEALDCEKAKSPRAIVYEGKKYSLASFVREMTGWSAAQGSNYLLFNGRTLKSIREELEQD